MPKKKKKQANPKFSLRSIFLVGILALILIPVFLIEKQNANAATPSSQYTYTLTGSSVIIPNEASAHTGVNLNLYGNWNQSDFGVHFAGDLVSQQSVGYAKPTSGPTIYIAANQSVGVAIKFRYQAPTGSTCFKDSSNITQIGKFAQNIAQIKLQLSNCGKNPSNVFIQCRIAGANTTTSSLPVTGTQALIDGGTYIAKCYKAPDPAEGNASLQLRTVRVDSAQGNQVTTDIFSIPKTGLIKSYAYLSVANKFPLPSISSNTDQFVGDIAKVAYCKTSTMDDVINCLNTEIPE